jgi:glycosyltransferase involved in cell wall biosynthesis
MEQDVKKKILFIASLNSIHTLRWINFFLKLNYEVSVISLKKKDKSYQFSNKVNLYIYEKFENNFLNILYCLFSVFIKRKFFSLHDIIHIHYIGFNALVSLFLKNKNLVLSPWGSDIKINRTNLLKKFFLKIIFKKSKVIITDSKEIKKLIIEMFGNIRGIFHIINFGVDTKLFSKKKYNLDLEKKLNIQNCRNYLKIISLRNHEKIYDIKTLIYSIKKLYNYNKKIKCLIYGAGSETENLKKLTYDLELENIINFKGKYVQEELPFIFSLVDCYVSTSLSDGGLSSSTAEAMACEVVAISSNNSENNLWIEHGKSGFLFKNGNVNELFKILRNINNFNLAEIGKHGRKIILKDYDYNREMNKVNDIYKLCLN